MFRKYKIALTWATPLSLENQGTLEFISNENTIEKYTHQTIF